MKQSPINSYNEWEIAISEVIMKRLDCDYGDACGIMEAAPFIMAQSWSMDLCPEEVANKIINQ